MGGGATKNKEKKRNKGPYAEYELQTPQDFGGRFRARKKRKLVGENNSLMGEKDLVWGCFFLQIVYQGTEREQELLSKIGRGSIRKI